MRVVVGRHEHRAGLVGDTLADGLAALAEAVVEDDLGPVAARVLDLQAGRILRHDDRRLYAEGAGGISHALGMIAGGIGHDAALALIRRQLGNPVIGAAELERAGLLQRLGLDEDAPAGPLVEIGGGQKRRDHRLAPDAECRCLDIGEGDGERRNGGGRAGCGHWRDSGNGVGKTHSASGEGPSTGHRCSPRSWEAMDRLPATAGPPR